MRWRSVEPGDYQLVADWNRELQVEEGAAPMETPEISTRLQRWLSAEYEAMIFEVNSSSIGYALFRPTDPDPEGPGGIYLRQFFIAPAHRRTGNGSRAFRLFVREAVRGRRLLLEALETNPNGRKFWRSLGLHVYSYKFELPPEPE
jgi:GNAT superfamily N-acetyltransferase